MSEMMDSADIKESSYCDIEDVECILYKKCMDIYRVAVSMNLKFRCPVVTAREHS